MTLIFDLINGMKLGIEYVSADPEEEGDVALVVIDLAVFRLIIVIP